MRHLIELFYGAASQAAAHLDLVCQLNLPFWLFFAHTKHKIPIWEIEQKVPVKCQITLNLQFSMFFSRNISKPYLKLFVQALAAATA